MPTHRLPAPAALAFLSVLAAATSTLAHPVPDSAPPAFADDAHVSNGCHISTLAYVARFAAEFPGERAEPLIVEMPNADGARRPHTLALVSWRGELWGRDEHFGVFPLKLSATANVKPERVATRAAAALERNARADARNPGYRRAPVAIGSVDSNKLRHEAELAARLLPVPATVYWVTTGGREYPLVFFRPDGRSIAVYDPHRGTCMAETASRDDAGIVAAVAGRLGYRPTSVPAALSATAVLAAR